MSDAVVACARTWIGTRFHHQGRVKKTKLHGGGVDCLGLLAGIAAELELRGNDGLLLALEDEKDYSHSPDAAYLQKRLSELLRRVEAGGLSPGHIVLLKVDGQPQHLGIISDYDGGLGVIHAYAPARAVVEHRLDEWWRAHIEAAYCLP